MIFILCLFYFFFLMIRRPPRSTLSLHDALPISGPVMVPPSSGSRARGRPSSPRRTRTRQSRSEEHTSELQSHSDLVCRLLLEKKKKNIKKYTKRDCTRVVRNKKQLTYDVDL